MKTNINAKERKFGIVRSLTYLCVPYKTESKLKTIINANERKVGKGLKVTEKRLYTTSPTFNSFFNVNRQHPG